MNKPCMPINLKSSIKWIKNTREKHNVVTDSRGNGSVTIKEIESVVKNLFTKQAGGSGALKEEFYRVFQEPTISSYTNSYREWKGKNDLRLILWNSPHLDARNRAGARKKETLQLSLTHEHRCKNPGENLVAKGSQQHVKRTTRSEGIGLTPGMQDWPFNGNVNQWTSPHTPNKGENPRGNLNRCR